MQKTLLSIEPDSMLEERGGEDKFQASSLSYRDEDSQHRLFRLFNQQ